tara:strand:+ start:1340 stop:1696 length:357 start_codon:yes stop_codon:yes gene_type:complete
MQLPEIIDHIILSFLGIKPRKKCYAITRKKTACRNATHHAQLLCTTHQIMLARQNMDLPFSTVFQTYKMIYARHRRYFNFRKKHDIYGGRRKYSWAAAVNSQKKPNAFMYTMGDILCL